MFITKDELKTIFEIKQTLDGKGNQPYCEDWSRFAISELISILEKQEYKENAKLEWVEDGEGYSLKQTEPYKKPYCFKVEYPTSQLVFVNGVMVDINQITLCNIKGVGWNGRAVEIRFNDPKSKPTYKDDVIVVQLGENKMRRFFCIKREKEDKEAWVGEDCISMERGGFNMLSEWRGLLLTDV